MKNHIEIEIGEDGLLRARTSDFKSGDTICLVTKPEINNHDKGRWSDVEKIAEQVDASTIPRRTHDEILRDLRDQRE